MRTFPGQIEFGWSWTLCPPVQPARWITPSRLAKPEGGKLIFGPPFGIIQHPSAAFGPRADFPRKEVFPKTFVRRRRFQPKIGQTAKKWLKLTGESEIDGVLEPVPRFFQASPIRLGLAARPDPIGSPLQ
jgi:hypothetical protein